MGGMNVPPIGGQGSFSAGSNPGADDLIAISKNIETIGDLLSNENPSKSDIQNQLNLISPYLSDLKAQTKGTPALKEAVAAFSDALDQLNQTVAGADLNSIGGRLNVMKAVQGVIDTGSGLAQLLR